jgi:hypothetical protein
MKFKMIQPFLCDVAWGDLDYLVVDCPPETAAQSYFSLADRLHEREDLWSGAAATAPASREVLQ